MKSVSSPLCDEIFVHMGGGKKKQKQKKQKKNISWDAKEL